MRVVVSSISFWFSAILVAYVYAGYPLLLWLLARVFPRKDRASRPTLPRVSILISAYNECDVIGAKIENALASDYPADHLEIMVISDCSDDGTDEIVAQYSGRCVRLVRQAKRLGKTEGLNLAMPQTRGDIVVFSDANAIYRPDAIRQLVQRFSDSRVGYVVGNARYAEREGQAASAQSEGLYWKLETWLKQKESDFGSVVGGDGAIYAIRRELFKTLRPTDINDFLNPLQIIAQGYLGVYEAAAVCFEEAGDSFEKEFHRKVRIISRSLNAIFREPRVLLPWIQPRHWFALVSHKVLRWFVPLFLLISLLSAALLWNSIFYRWAFCLQLAFYCLAIMGWALARRGKEVKLFYIPYYYCLVNLASSIGVVKFFTGSLSPTWQTVRHVSTQTQDSGVRLTDKES